MTGSCFDEGETPMEHRAVLFDLFETLITEWGHRKYTKNDMCSDLGIDRETFDRYWEGKEKARCLGEISFEESILYVCDQCGKQIDSAALVRMAELRTRTKSVCFEYIQFEVLELLDRLKGMGLPMAIVSNCSPEEVIGIGQSNLYPYFDQVILSYEVGLQKPDVRIYQEAAGRLGVAPEACVFIGDGGSHELDGAKNTGMTAIQAKWYTNEHPRKRESIPGFLTAERPLDVLRHVRI